MQTTTEEETTTPRRSKKDKPNGRANGNGAAPDNGVAFPTPADDPADAAAATEPEEKGPDHYEATEPAQDEIEIAVDVFRKLKDDAREMGDQAVIDALIGIVDVHKQLRTPELFGSGSDEDDKYETADNVAEIARILCASSSKLVVNPNYIVFYWKDHEKWTSHGQKVHGSVKRFDGFHQHHNDGQLAAVLVNYHLFKTLNPRQKIFQVYHLLRELDEKGGTRAPDYVGYFDEPGLFGAGVSEEMCNIARAFIRDAKAHVGDVHQLSLMAGIFDD